MKLDPKYKPELCASDDNRKFNITLPYLDASAKTIAATNGHALVVVPVEVEEGEKSRHIVQPEMDRARNPVSLKAEDIVRDRGKFPDIAQVVPKYRPGDEDTFSIGLSAKLLLDIAQAIGADRDRVLLTFPAGEALKPILVTLDGEPSAGDPFGVLMPVRYRIRDLAAPAIDAVLGSK